MQVNAAKGPKGTFHEYNYILGMYTGTCLFFTLLTFSHLFQCIVEDTQNHIYSCLVFKFFIGTCTDNKMPVFPLLTLSISVFAAGVRYAEEAARPAHPHKKSDRIGLKFRLANMTYRCLHHLQQRLNFRPVLWFNYEDVLSQTIVTIHHTGQYVEIQLRHILLYSSTATACALMVYF